MDLGREEGYLIAKEGFDRIIEAVKAKGKTNTREMVTQANDHLLRQSTASQTTSTATVNAVMQTASDDEPPRLLRDAGTSPEPLSLSQTTPCRTVPSPQPAPPPRVWICSRKLPMAK